MAYIDNKLGDGEKVIYVTHQHPLVLLRAAAGFILIFFLGLFALVAISVFITNQLITDPNFQTLVKNVLIFASFIAMFIGVLGFLLRYLTYINEEYIITNERVIQVSGVVNKRELDSSLSKVNDVQTLQGLIGRLFDYGTVNIVTGNEIINQLDYLHHPFDFKKHMLNAKNGLYGDASDLAGQGAFIRGEDGERRYRVAPPPQQPLPNNPSPQGAFPPPVPIPAPGQPINRAEIPAMIQQLARLRDAGVLSPEEFQAKKDDLLRRL